MGVSGGIAHVGLAKCRRACPTLLALHMPSEEDRTKGSTSLKASDISQLCQLYALGSHGDAMHLALTMGWANL